MAMAQPRARSRQAGSAPHDRRARLRDPESNIRQKIARSHAGSPEVMSPQSTTETMRSFRTTTFPG